jgi:uncharacterized membrane protein
MTHIDISPVRRTSVTMRTATRATLQEALALFLARGLNFSEQRLMRECLRLALKFWRGRRDIARRNKKYNQCLGPYEIVPFYTTEALRSIACARCHHSGISLSRMMDFAIARYLPRVIEEWLSVEFYWRDRKDIAAWAGRYARRRASSDFVINYDARTEKNNGIILEFCEKSEILPWPPPSGLPL